MCVSWRDFLKAWVTGSELWASRDMEPDISIPVRLFLMMIWSSDSLTYSGRSVGFQHLLIVNMINIQEIFSFALYRRFASIFYDIINSINFRTHNIFLPYRIFYYMIKLLLSKKMLHVQFTCLFPLYDELVCTI